MKQSPIKTFSYYFLQFTWGIIQNAIGLLLFLILKTSNTRKFNYSLLCNWKHSSSLSLGIFIFLGNDRLFFHEYGHSIQSAILGPFYLLIIGIPSFIWATCFKKYRKINNIDYYSFYTERWANYLANKYLNTNIMEV